jgi:hypothetical protein
MGRNIREASEEKQEEEDALFVEGFNGEGQLQVQMRYDIASL